MQATINSLPGEPGNALRLHTNPALLLMAFHNGINDIHHVRPVVERRKRRRSGITPPARHGKTAPSCFKRIGPAFDVPAGEVSAVGHIAVHQTRIVTERLIGLCAVANPQLLRHLLIPCHRPFAAVDFKRQTVLRPALTCETLKQPLLPSSKRNRTEPTSSVVTRLSSYCAFSS